MAKNVNQYDLLISCPGDIQTEVEIIKEIIEDFNERYLDILGISLRARHWKKSSYAQSGGKPQFLLNEQFVKQCDAAVAVFWTRFGTPTDEYGSGSEEEIELMLEADKQVFMYFSDKPTPPSVHNPVEYEKICAFREKYKDRGIYFTYTSDGEFKKLFSAHLAQHFLSLKKIDEIKDLRTPRLVLRGINENQILCETAPVQNLILRFKRNTDDYISVIKKMYQDIAGLHVGSYVPQVVREISSAERYLESFYPRITIKKEEKKLLVQTASVIDMSLPDDFFGIGNLSEDKLKIPTVGGRYSLKGTEEEKKKYELIQSLCNTIIEFSEQIDIKRSFAKIKCLSFAIENNGTSIDEDIEITLTFLKSDLLTLNEFPEIDNLSKKYLMNEVDMDKLFEIPGTAQYMSYNSGIKPLSMGKFVQPRYINPSPFIEDEENFSEQYEKELSRIFPYEIYPNGENYICKLKLDYIKHHTAVAFPTPILLKEIPVELPYAITSKNSAEIIQGTLKISDNIGDK